VADKRQHFSLLNAIRGLAAILIVDRHAGLLQPFSAPMSFMAVDLFFLLSGVVIEASYSARLSHGMKPSRFMWIRIARLYPLYLLGTAIAVAAYALSGKHLSLGYGPLSFAQSPSLHIVLALFMLPAPFGHTPMFEFDSPAWSLFFELAVNFIYALVITRLTGRVLVAIFAFFGTILLASLVHFHVAEIGFWSPNMYIAGLCRAGFSFFLGVGLYRLNNRSQTALIRRHSGFVSAAVLVSVAALLIGPRGSHPFACYILAVFVIFPALVFISLSIESGRMATKIWNFLGDMSYPIYALHVPILIFFSSVLIVPFGQPSLVGNLVVRCIYAISMITFAYVAMKVYDQPAREFMRRLHIPQGMRMASH